METPRQHPGDGILREEIPSSTQENNKHLTNKTLSLPYKTLVAKDSIRQPRNLITLFTPMKTIAIHQNDDGYLVKLRLERHPSFYNYFCQLGLSTLQENPGKPQIVTERAKLWKMCKFEDVQIGIVSRR